MNQFRPFLLIAWLACAALLYFEWVSPTPEAPVPAASTAVPTGGALPSVDRAPYR